MYIYNVTINVETEIQEEWLQWIQNEHIPDMLNTGKFQKAILTEVQVEEETGGVTYAIQYWTDSKATLDAYYSENAAQLRAESKRFAGKFVAFRTELKVISQH